MSENPRGVSDHPNKDLMEELWRAGERATAILAFLEEAGLPLISERTLARYGQRNWSEPSASVQLQTDGTPDELTDLVKQITDSDLGTVKKVVFSKKVWPAGTSVGQTVEVIPNTEPPLAQAEITSINVNVSGVKEETKPEGWKLGIDYPDAQIGYYRDSDGSLTTTHDEAAFDVAHQITAWLDAKFDVDLIVNQGDNLDFPGFSTHRSSPGYLGNLKHTINRGGSEAAVQRQLAPGADIVWIAGNHEYRLDKAVVDRLPELVAVSRAGEDEPVLSIPYLLKFEEYDIQYIESYPDGEYWANDFLRFKHGSMSSGVPGVASGKHLGAHHFSTIFGHGHKQELAYTRYPTRDGVRTSFAGCAGCLCRTDGVVPSSSVGIKSNGRQSGTEKWTQGIFVFWYEPDGAQRAFVEPVLIDNGTAIFRGQVFTASVDANGDSL